MRSSTQNCAPESFYCRRADDSARLDTMQTVRRVLHGEEHDVTLRRRFAGVHRVGGDVDDRARLNVDFLAADIGVERFLPALGSLVLSGANARPRPSWP